MKTNLLLALSLLCAGCQSSNPPPKSVSPSPRPATHTAPIGLRVPETIKTYAVGAYVDPDDESVRHDAHLIHRLEKPTRWNLTPHAPEPVPLPPAQATLTPLPPPTPIVTPIPPPTPRVAPIDVSSAMPVITPPVSPIPAPIVATSAQPASPAPTQPAEPILTPNADGVIDLAALEQSVADDANPFAVRAQTPGALREISVRVSGVFLATTSGALVNDRPLLIGESAESLILFRVEPDAALFRTGTRQVRVPVSGRPVVVRFAP